MYLSLCYLLLQTRPFFFVLIWKLVHCWHFSLRISSWKFTQNLWTVWHSYNMWEVDCSPHLQKWQIGESVIYNKYRYHWVGSSLVTVWFETTSAAHPQFVLKHCAKMFFQFRFANRFFHLRLQQGQHYCHLT